MRLFIRVWCICGYEAVGVCMCICVVCMSVGLYQLDYICVCITMSTFLGIILWSNLHLCVSISVRYIWCIHVYMYASVCSSCNTYICLPVGLYKSVHACMCKSAGMSVWLYVCIYLCLCGWEQEGGKATTLPFRTLCTSGRVALSAGALHRHRAWVAELGLDSSLHQHSHLASCRRKHLGRGGGHFGRAGSPFALIFVMQGPSQRIQSENYPNQCSLMVSKCHDSREVHGSIPLTDIHILYRLQGQPLTQPLRPWSWTSSRLTPSPSLALSSSLCPGLSSSTCFHTVEKHSLEFRVAHCCHGSSHSLHFC